MSRKQMLWLSSGVWGAGFMVCGAFAFAMNQPLVLHLDTTPTPMERAESHEVLRLTPSSTPTPSAPLVFPELVITAPRAHVAAAAPEPAQDLQQMNCAEWRPLEQGGNSVRECR